MYSRMRYMAAAGEAEADGERENKRRLPSASGPGDFLTHKRTRPLRTHTRRISPIQTQSLLTDTMQL
ncbi:Protein of unknown function [Gryllus bimaculatus]|nr:Protein of unknown function [Gryllus bimaculatus]